MPSTENTNEPFQNVYSDTFDNVTIEIKHGQAEPWNPVYNGAFSTWLHVEEHMTQDLKTATLHEYWDARTDVSSVIEGDWGGVCYITDEIWKINGNKYESSWGPLVQLHNHGNRGPARSNNDLIRAGGGDDIVYGKTGTDELYGDDGNDQLFGGVGEDKLYGGKGNDQLIGGQGADFIDGGEGFDTVAYDDATSGVTIDLLSQTGQGGDAEGDIYRNIEWARGSKYNDEIIGNNAANVLDGGLGADTLNAGAGDDRLLGRAGNDKLYGEKGNDRLEGGEGADLLNGGDGIDSATYINSTAGVKVNLSSGICSGGEAEGDQLISIEELQGSNFADELVGTNGNDRIFGAGGDDVIVTGAGSDLIDGGEGTDFLAGGVGDDIYVFRAGSGVDIVAENINEGTDTAYFDGITSVNIYKQNNDLLIGVNENKDIMQFKDWYASNGSHTVENFYFAASNETYTAEQFAEFAVDITPPAA